MPQTNKRVSTLILTPSPTANVRHGSKPHQPHSLVVPVEPGGAVGGGAVRGAGAGAGRGGAAHAARPAAAAGDDTRCSYARLLVSTQDIERNHAFY